MMHSTYICTFHSIAICECHVTASKYIIRILIHNTLKCNEQLDCYRGARGVITNDLRYSLPNSVLYCRIYCIIHPFCYW